MNILSKILIGGLLCFGLASCPSMGTNPGDNIVVAEQQDLLVLPPQPEVYVVDRANIPESMQTAVETLFPGDQPLVLTTEDHLQPNASPIIPLTFGTGSEGYLDGALKTIGGIAGSFPGGEPVAIITGVLGWLLAWNRSRGHMVNSAKDLSKLKFKEAGKSLLKAVGSIHSEDGSIAKVEKTKV